jgi:hypothetical protein
MVREFINNEGNRWRERKRLLLFLLMDKVEVQVRILLMNK